MCLVSPGFLGLLPLTCPFTLSRELRHHGLQRPPVHSFSAPWFATRKNDPPGRSNPRVENNAITQASPQSDWRAAPALESPD